MFKIVLPISTVVLMLAACGNEPRAQLRLTVPHLKPVSAPLHSDSQSVLQVPTGDRELVDFMFQHNAALQVEMHQRDASGMRIQSVVQMPDTMIKVTPIGDMVETAGGEMMTSIGIEQSFPALGVLKNKRFIAAEQMTMQEAALDALKVQLVRSLRTQVVRRASSWEVLAIIEENIKTIKSIWEVVDARIAVGSADRSQLLDVEMMQSQLLQTLQEWQARRLDAEAQLRLVLGISASISLPQDIAPYVLPEAMHKQSALQLVQLQHPQLRMAVAKQEAAFYQEQLAQASGRPGFSVGFQYSMIDDGGLSPAANGDDIWSLQFGMRIPLDRSAVEARRSEAALNNYKEQWNIESTRQRLDQEFESALRLFESAGERWRLSYEEIVPRSRERFELLKSGYETGKSSYVDVMDAWRQVLQVEIQERQLFYMQLEKQYKLLSQMGLLFWPTQDKGPEHE